MDNLPLKMTTEHIDQLKLAIEGALEGLTDIQIDVNGYSREVVEFEVALILARRAALYGIDLLKIGEVKRSRPRNG